MFWRLKKKRRKILLRVTLSISWLFWLMNSEARDQSFQDKIFLTNLSDANLRREELNKWHFHWNT